MTVLLSVSPGAVIHPAQSSTPSIYSSAPL